MTPAPKVERRGIVLSPFQHQPFFDTLRNNCKTDASVNAIDGEVVTIQCEDPSDAFSLSHSNEGGVREIHRAVGILNH